MARRKRYDDRMLLVAGETVVGRANRYQVNSIVGSGAYATVYSGTDEIGRKVALKEIYPSTHPRETPMLKALYERERYVLSLVSPHPLMPAFYEGFESDNHYYLAQEFIDGRSLDEVIVKTKLNNDWMLRWAASLCYALAYLHDLQIVHHDIKPANIRIRPNGRLALIDFGAARYFGKDDALIPESFSEDDDLYGTEGYLPPEVDEPGNFGADVRTDIFALGCVLYEMVMGEPPEQKKINERTSFITTPLMSRKDVDLSYVKLVTTALSFNTDYRYATVNVFLDALKPISPPLLMISTKQLSFGKRQLAEGPITRKFTIFNGGSGGEFHGDVKSKSPWLTIEMPAFRGQKRDMIVVADPAKVPERNKLVHGAIEVWTAEKRDEDNRIANPSEKLFIECSIFVTPSTAQLSVARPLSQGEIAYGLRYRKGFECSMTLSISNAGDSKASVVVKAPKGLCIEPPTFEVDGHSTVQITVTASATAELKTDVTLPIQLTYSGGGTLEVPIALRSGSLVEGIRGLFKR
jgi:serine/threonine protein kinase